MTHHDERTERDRMDEARYEDGEPGRDRELYDAVNRDNDARFDAITDERGHA